MRAGLSAGDPKASGQTVGKAKRVRAVLSWAMENAPSDGEILVAALLSLIRGKGRFRVGSRNHVGIEPIADIKSAFRLEGFNLSDEGEMSLANLEELSGLEVTTAFESYIRRAQKGSEDAALLLGTSRDLLEAVAAHVIVENYGQ